jgi:ankyrin repeat protein
MAQSDAEIRLRLYLSNGHALKEAARNGDVRAMAALLAKGADSNFDGGAPLKIVVGCGYTAAAQWLVSQRWLLGVDVNASDEIGWTALHEAAAHGHHEIMGALLAAGADMHALSDAAPQPWSSRTSNLLETPLSCASLPVADFDCRKRSKICAKLLLSHGARVDEAGVAQRTPLWVAISRGRDDLVKMLLQAGAREITDLPWRTDFNEYACQMVEAIRAAGGWPEVVVAHRRVLAGLVAKLSAKTSKSEVAQSVPVDVASLVVAFWCPAGGFCPHGGRALAAHYPE